MDRGSVRPQRFGRMDPHGAAGGQPAGDQGDREAMRFTYSAPSRVECERRLWAHERLRRENGFAPWVAVLRAAGRVVGWGGLGVDPFEPGWGVEVSYSLHPAHWGRGLATELVRAAVAHGFETLGLPEIVAFTDPANHRSLAVMRRLGMRPDPSRDFEHPAIPPGHPLRPHRLFALTRAEWTRAPHPGA